jgi:pimeloyl-ACP methyl ester carboxylesterase
MYRLALISVRLLVGMLVLVSVAPGSSTVHAAGPSIGALRAAGAAKVQEVYVRAPQGGVDDGQPVQVVIALHGMGGNGPDFANALAEQADRYGWLLIAPTIKYGDWTDPDKIAREDPALVAWLSGQIRQRVDNADVPVEPRVLLFGHSRGAQLALRFAEIHPELVGGVAAISAGTYTLPVAHDSHNRPLEFPFGIANLARDDGGKAFDVHTFSEVPVWIGVGSDDTNPNDVPDAWDPYIGDDRRERAERWRAR